MAKKSRRHMAVSAHDRNRPPVADQSTTHPSECTLFFLIRGLVIGAKHSLDCRRSGRTIKGNNKKVAGGKHVHPGHVVRFETPCYFIVRDTVFDQGLDSVSLMTARTRQ